VTPLTIELTTREDLINTLHPLNFWMGGWDGDALCAYISGYLSIPFAAACRSQ
jgi:hypothetical protein